MIFQTKLEEKRTMTKPKKQFSPHIFAEWGELFEPLTNEQKAEILMAITKYPNYDPINVPIWAFIKSQLDKDYEYFTEKCEKNGQISRDYWKNKKLNDTERIPNDIERNPKLITNNELTETETKTKTKTKKTDPYFSPIKQFFIEEYQKIFNKRGYLSNNHIMKLSELESEIDDLKEKIPEVLFKLKQIDWDIGYTPDINWLLKDDNFISVLNGEYDKKKIGVKNNKNVQDILEQALGEFKNEQR